MKKRKINRAKRGPLKSCRNHGTCDWCKDSRLYQAQKEDLRTAEQIDEQKNISFRQDEIERDLIRTDCLESYESLRRKNEI